MDCLDFERWIERFEIGAAAVEPEYREHADDCWACRQLLQLMELRVPLPGMTNDWTQRVVEATSGSPCDVVESWIGDRSRSAAHDAVGARLVEVHLTSCVDCSALAGILGTLDDELRELQEVRVPIGFAEQVLARTLPLDVRLRRRFRVVWQRWLRRPRFATELAYALTVLLLLVVGNPAAPLSAMSKSARELSPVVDRLAANAQPREVVEVLKRSVRESETVGLASEFGGWLTERGERLRTLGVEVLDQAELTLDAAATFLEEL
jgi:hypothetical protein